MDLTARRAPRAGTLVHAAQGGELEAPVAAPQVIRESVGQRSDMFREASIDCPADLKERWPVPLADEWHKGYPELFDDDDLRLAHNQPAYHFFEWLSAIYLFHRDGVHALVEKYAYGNHLRKTRLLEELVAQDERDFIRGFRDAFGVQPPDLLVFRPDRSAYWFAEAKGPSDRLSRRQRRGHEQIVATLGVPVELIDVHMA